MAASQLGLVLARLLQVRSDPAPGPQPGAREDFERKLHSKRSKVQVRFVELTDTIPVQGPETEVIDGLMYGDFLALLDPRERQVVVLLRSGITKLDEIASLMGYKNHSPVSKRLARIREKAAAYFREL